MESKMDDSTLPYQPPLFIKLKNEDGQEDIHYSRSYEGIPDEFKTEVEQELKETDEKRTNGLMKLKNFLKKENIQYDDENMLIAVLRNSKYNIKKSETKLKKFLKVRNMIVEKVKRTDVRKVEMILDDECLVSLPYRDKKGRLICIARPTFNLTADTYQAEDVAVTAFTGILSSLRYPMASVTGAAFILDCKCETLSTIYDAIKIIKHYIIGGVLAIPYRIGRIDVVNENAIVRCFSNLIRPFLPTKISERIAFHGSDLKSLHKVYNPALLPTFLGGTLDQVEQKFSKERVLGYMQILKSEGLV